MNHHQQENQNEINNTAVFLAGLLLGSLAGASTMLFLAPQSGEKTRAQVWQKGYDWQEQTAETVTTRVAQVRAGIDQATTSIHKQAEDLQQSGQDLVDQQKERWQPVVDAGTTALNNN